MISLEFNPDLGYGDFVVDGRDPGLEQYMRLPVVQWCHEHIGPVQWPKADDQALAGQGWQIRAEWTVWPVFSVLTAKPRVFIDVTADLDQRLITEFWMRFMR